MPAIEINAMSYRYPDTSNMVLKNIDLKINEGEFVGIIGPNSAAKTTLCLTLNGVIPHSIGGKLQGRVVVDGMNTLDHTVPELAVRVGLVISDPEAQLLQLTVEEEVAFGPANLGIPRGEIFQRTKEMIALVGLDGKESRFPLSLSGGEMQRLAIASVLAMQPKIIVLDEPTANLDPAGTMEVFSVVREIKERTKMTVVMAEHQIEHLVQFADRILVMDNGEVILDGTPKEIFKETETLEKIGIEPPQVTEMSHLLLKDHGISLGGEPLTIEEAYKLIIERLA